MLPLCETFSGTAVCCNDRNVLKKEAFINENDPTRSRKTTRPGQVSLCARQNVSEFLPAQHHRDNISAVSTNRNAKTHVVIIVPSGSGELELKLAQIRILAVWVLTDIYACSGIQKKMHVYCFILEVSIFVYYHSGLD